MEWTSPLLNGGAHRAQETDAHRIKVRQKQIEFGYNTLGYARYLELVPKPQRGRDKNLHPRTPDPYQVCSKRSYDGQIRKWRGLRSRFSFIHPSIRRSFILFDCSFARALKSRLKASPST